RHGARDRSRHVNEQIAEARHPRLDDDLAALETRGHHDARRHRQRRVAVHPQLPQPPRPHRCEEEVAQELQAFVGQDAELPGIEATSDTDDARSGVKSCSVSTEALSSAPSIVTIAMRTGHQNRRPSATTPNIPNGTNSRMFCTTSGIDTRLPVSGDTNGLSV